MTKLTPYNEFQYSIWEPPTRSALPADDPRVIVFTRTEKGEARILLDGQPLEQRIVYHSPTGLEFGYGGSGPGDTAINILALVVSPKEADRLHQDFKWAHIANIPRKGTTLQLREVIAWVGERYRIELSDPERMELEADQWRREREIAEADAAERAAEQAS